MRDTAYRAMQVKEALIAENNREPTVEEIAKRMGRPQGGRGLALEAIVEPVSLYEPVYSDGGDTIYVVDQVGDPSRDTDWLDELSFKDAITNLSDREKQDPLPAVSHRKDPSGGSQRGGDLPSPGQPVGKRGLGSDQKADVTRLEAVGRGSTWGYPSRFPPDLPFDNPLFE